MKDFVKIFIVFSKIGAVTFGGGYAMLPILQKDIVARKWVTDAEITDFYAIAQSLPGVIAVNVSMLIGHKHRGKVGFFAAMLGVLSPSIVFILIIAMFLQSFMQHDIVGNAFTGISIAVLALILNTAKSMLKSNVTDKASKIIFMVSFNALLLFSVSPILPILFGALYGVIFRKGD